ncbi:MAG TPA: hypothetical protein V6C90_28220 [Coleofasciculaceae cyanobacterium]
MHQAMPAVDERSWTRSRSSLGKITAPLSALLQNAPFVISKPDLTQLVWCKELDS